MTCVVATREFMAADRRINDTTGMRAQPENKVAVVGGMIVGMAGRACLQYRLTRLDVAPRSPHDLLQHLKSGEDFALVLHQGQIWELACGYAHTVDSPVHAFGSGAEAALGFIAGAGSYDEETVKDAIAFSSVIRADCGDGVTVIRP